MTLEEDPSELRLTENAVERDCACSNEAWGRS